MNASLGCNNSLSHIYQKLSIFFGKTGLEPKWNEKSNLLSSSELVCLVSILHSPQS